MGFPGFALILKIVSFVVSSWLLVHLLAIFGVFLALAYPLWWFLAPQKLPCLFCRLRKEGERCPLCRRSVNKAAGLHPKSFSSVFLNGLLIFSFSFVSFGLVFAESQLLFKLGFPPTRKTVSFVIPAKGQYRLGEIFPMKIEIVGVGKPINVIQADIGFDPQKLEVVDISTTESFANIFLQEEINNEAGYARLTGGLPNPGFLADHGIFGTFFLQGKSSGLAQVEFLPSSLVLANDGRGTNVLKTLAAASYLILSEELSDEEKEQQQVLLQPAVLGEETSGVQLKLYEETSVLGAQIEREIDQGGKKGRTDFGEILLGAVENLDRFTLSLWGRLGF